MTRGETPGLGPKSKTILTEMEGLIFTFNSGFSSKVKRAGLDPPVHLAIDRKERFGAGRMKKKKLRRFLIKSHQDFFVGKFISLLVFHF